MPVETLLTTPCTITLNSQATTIEDDYGNEVSSNPPTISTLCHVQQQLRTEDTGQGELSETRWVGFFLAGTEFTTADVIEVDGHGTFEVIGDPWPVDGPYAGEHHREATLSRTGPETGS